MTEATALVTGIATGGATFVGTIYDANAIGKVIVLLGVAGAIVSFGKMVFLSRKRI
jgi:hypothetical protein